MKERPILFSGPMVRAILEGRKTQTRRVVKPQPPSKFPFAQDGTLGGITAFWWTDKDIDLDDIAWWPGYDDQDAVKCPYGSPGDRLWVRETWCHIGSHTGPHTGVRTIEDVRYKADGDGYVWRPSIFMPRWASRITLEIVSVRVERLQDISEEDAETEGYERETFYRELDKLSIARKLNRLTGVERMPAQSWFIDLWESINGAGSWEANPWVWVIEFKREGLR